jgi:hypothetical protein
MEIIYRIQVKQKRKISWYAYLKKRSFNICGKQNNTTPSEQFKSPIEKNVKTEANRDHHRVIQ